MKLCVVLLFIFCFILHPIVADEEQRATSSPSPLTFTEKFAVFFGFKGGGFKGGGRGDEDKNIEKTAKQKEGLQRRSLLSCTAGSYLTGEFFAYKFG